MHSRTTQQPLTLNWSPQETDLIESLSILNYYPDLSDHCPMSIRTNINKRPATEGTSDEETGVTVEFTKAHWTKENKEAVANNLNQESTRAKCSEILNRMSTQHEETSVDVAVNELKEVLFSAMVGNGEVTFSKILNKKYMTKKRPNQILFDEECEESKKELR